MVSMNDNNSLSLVTYKIRYWLSGNIKVIYIKAKDLKEALVYFYMNYPCDGVIDVVE